MPWLSVLIPTYNSEAFLPYTLDSILIQKDEDIECIVVDDGSTDSTVSILGSYQDRLPIKVLQRKRVGNWVANTNFALSIAKGKHICFLHQDDVWLKDRLRIMRQLTIDFPDIVLYLHPSNFINLKGQKLGLWSCPLPPAPEIIKPNLILERLLVQNYISILGTVFKKDAAEKVEGLDESLWYTADWDFWLKIAAIGDSVYYPKPLSGFRIHAGSQTIMRSSYLKDFRGQLDHVANKHIDLWVAPDKKKEMIRKIATFSNEVNSSLAGAMYGTKPDLFELIKSFLILGPSGWIRFFRDSRIAQRASARLRLGLTISFKSRKN